MSRPKIDPKQLYPCCERCGIKTPRIDRLDSTALTGKCGYWRQMPDKPSICSDCQQEASEVLDAWWMLKGKSRFHIKKEMREWEEPKKESLNMDSKKRVKQKNKLIKF